jgi:hypothetical protein
MQTSAARTTPVTDEWRRWIAENLMLDSPAQHIFEMLVRSGVSIADAQHEVHAALASPYVAGAQRLRNRLGKRKWVLDNQRRLARLRSPEIPRIDRLPADAFLEDFYTAGRPVVITGMIDDWPARRKWDLDFFSREFGDREVQVQFGRSADAHYEMNSLRHKKTMRFGEYVELVRNAGRSNDFYMTANNDAHNRAALPGLWRDIVSIPEYLNPDTPGRCFFWFGPAGTITPLHHDLTNNFMAQVMGRKRVLIVPACEIDHMYNHQHCFTHVDAGNIDYERFPQMRDVQILDCTIGPGDVLFLPVGCWHYVEGLDVSVTVTFTNFKWDNTYTERYPALQEF